MRLDHEKKKWVYILIIVVLAVLVLFFYTAFNGNPITKQLSKMTLNSYLDTNYPNEEFTIDKPFYNIKDSVYDFSVTRIGDSNQTQYDFTVTGIFNTKVQYDGIYYANQDTRLIKKFEKEAEEELSNLLIKDVPEIIEINVQMEILKGKHDLESVWNKGFIPEKPMYIYIAIDSRKLSIQEFFKATTTIQNSLNENSYDYWNVSIDGKLFDNVNEIEDQYSWYVKYSSSFEKDTLLDLKQVQQYDQ